MLYLVGAILCSALMSVALRVSGQYVKNRMLTFTVNYVICGIIGAFFVLREPGAIQNIPLTLGLGGISGVMYLVCLFLLEYTIQKSGLVMASVFNKLGVLVPILMAIIVFRDYPSWMQIVGIALAIAAILLMNLSSGKEGGEGGGRKGMILLLVLLLVAGLTDSIINIFDKLGNPADKDYYLLLNFGSAFLCSLVVTLVQHKPLSGKDFLFGVLIGVPNYFSSRLLLLSLGSVPAVVAYPVYCVGTLAVITLTGLLFFREKLGLRKAIGIGLIFVALVLLNI